MRSRTGTNGSHAAAVASRREAAVRLPQTFVFTGRHVKSDTIGTCSIRHVRICKQALNTCIFGRKSRTVAAHRAHVLRISAHRERRHQGGVGARRPRKTASENTAVVLVYDRNVQVMLSRILRIPKLSLCIKYHTIFPREA